MLSKFCNPYKSLFVGIFGLFVLTIFWSPFVFGADYYPEDENQIDKVEIQGTKSNVYAAGKEVELAENVSRDVYAAGEDIKVDKVVGRSLFLAGENISIKTPAVGGSTKVIGKKVILSGNFTEEVMVTGYEVEIVNAVIREDVAILANEITVKDSRIDGDVHLVYSSLDGDLESQVAGSINSTIIDWNGGQFSLKSIFLFLILTKEFSAIIIIFLVTIYLYSKKKLDFKEVGFNTNFGLDLAVGLGLIILPILVVALSLLVQLWWITLPLALIIYLSFFVTSFTLPIYLANLIKNTAKSSISIPIWIVITYLFLLVVNYTPVGIVLGIFIILLQIVNFGFITRLIARTINRDLNRKNVDISEKKRIN